MKKLLFLWLVSLPTLAQTKIDIQGFKGNVIVSQPLPLSASDTLKLITVRATYTSLPNSLTTNPQPSIERRGQAVIVRFENSDNLPESGWYQLFVAGQVRYFGEVVVNKRGTSFPPTSPIPNPQTDFTNTKTYQLANAPPGYTIGHNKANRYVKATFFREDTGQIDPLWRVHIVNDNVVTLEGPSNERFSGRVALEFVPLTNN